LPVVVGTLALLYHPCIPTTAQNGFILCHPAKNEFIAAAFSISNIVKNKPLKKRL
jgi:hypothetical protein